jgi:hypothetical protein
MTSKPGEYQKAETRARDVSGDLDAFIGRDDLSEATARQILWENPCRLYGLSKEKLCANVSPEQKQSAT